MLDIKNKFFANINYRSKIGILGGSFDPPHVGHQLIIFNILISGFLDYSFITPCINHPFNKTMSSFIHRLGMCKKAFSKFSKNKVLVLDLENYLIIPTFSANTIESIKLLRPDLSIFIIIGSDNWNKINKWYKYKYIYLLSNFIIFHRKNIINIKLKKNISLFTISNVFYIPNISSTYVRKILNKKNIQKNIYLKNIIDKKILNYIIDNKLYI